MSRQVQHGRCPETGKARFASEHDALKALGRSQSLRVRKRGARIESRHFYCDQCGGWHLTSMSRRQFTEKQQGHR